MPYNVSAAQMAVYSFSFPAPKQNADMFWATNGYVLFPAK